MQSVLRAHKRRPTMRVRSFSPVLSSRTNHPTQQAASLWTAARCGTYVGALRKIVGVVVATRRPEPRLGDRAETLGARRARPPVRARADVLRRSGAHAVAHARHQPGALVHLCGGREWGEGKDRRGRGGAHPFKRMLLFERMRRLGVAVPPIVVWVASREGAAGRQTPGSECLQRLRPAFPSPPLTPWQQPHGHTLHLTSIFPRKHGRTN